MEYDFSKIKTEELRVAVFKEGCCWGIDCEPCPFCGKPGEVSACDTDKDDIKRLFKSELNRREKMENKMPELKAGMVVEREWVYAENTLELVIDEWGCNLDDSGYTSNNDSASGNAVKIYKIKNPCTLSSIKDNLELIWSKKSDKDIKIEELEATIKKAQEQIQELKG